MIQKIGVIGAGQMGSGIAQVCAVAGYDVTLVDVSAEALAKAVSEYRPDLEQAGGEGQVRRPKTRTRPWSGSPTGTDLAMFGASDLVIEAATEERGAQAARSSSELDAARARRRAGDQHVVDSDHANRGRDPTARKLIGMHFMNPVPVMQLVELIRGAATSTRPTDAKSAGGEDGEENGGGRRTSRASS